MTTVAATILTDDGNTVVESADTTQPTFSLIGDLAPGEYELIVQALADTNQSEVSASIDFEFSAGSGNVTVIPLPPGAWAGAIGLLTAAAAMRLPRWRRRA